MEEVIPHGKSVGFSTSESIPAYDENNHYGLLLWDIHTRSKDNLISVIMNAVDNETESKPQYSNSISSVALNVLREGIKLV